MTTDEAIQLLKEFNAWRCGADTPMLNPREITEAINTVTGIQSDRDTVIGELEDGGDDGK